MTRKSKSPETFDIETAIVRVAELGVLRRQFIRAKNRIGNAQGALVRRALGWQLDLPEKEQAQIVKKAAKLLACEDYATLPADMEAIANALGPHIETFNRMAEPAELSIKQIELAMRKLAKQLPVWEWGKGVKGLSDLGLAIIVSEAGALNKYSNIGKLWKRLGLAPFQKDGVTRAYSQWRTKGGLTADDWTAAGYSPKRRAAIYAQVGTQIIGGMGKGYRPTVGEDIEQNAELSYYQKVFVHRLRYEAARDPEQRRPDTKEDRESYSKRAAFMALRYTEKRLLKHLWQAWRRADRKVAEMPVDALPAARSPQSVVDAIDDRHA